MTERAGAANLPTTQQRDADSALAPVADPATLQASGGWLAAARRWLAGLGERLQVKYRLFQAGAAVVPRTPYWLAYPLVVGGATLAWALAGSLRRRVAANLAHIPALAANPQRLRWATRGVFVASALNYLDFFRVRRLTPAPALAPWRGADGQSTIENIDQLRDLVAQGRGVIVVTLHMGNFEAAASCLGAMGYRMITPAERLTPEPFSQLVTRLRDHHGTRMAPGDSRETLRELIASLKRNELVVFAVDRYIMGNRARFNVFGAPAWLPTTPAAFALRHHAPVVLLTSWRVGPQRSRGVCVPLDLAAATEPAATPQVARSSRAAPGQPGNMSNVDQAMAVVIAAIERQIAAHPEQWLSALAQVWDDGASDDIGATDQSVEAR